MPESHAARLALLAFLEAHYEDGELRQLAYKAFAPADIYLSLSGAGASRSELAFDIMEDVARRYPTPPASLWAYLYETRPRWRPQITQLRAGFGDIDPAAIAEPRRRVELERSRLPPDPTTHAGPEPAHELHSVLPSHTHGRCDLLVCPRPSHDEPDDPFAFLRPGLVNGVQREFSLAWTAHDLTVRTVPTLYRDGSSLPSRVLLPLPLRAEQFAYYPLGRNGCSDPAAVGPTVYRFYIERWDRGARRIALAADGGRRWRIDLHETHGGN